MIVKRNADRLKLFSVHRRPFSGRLIVSFSNKLTQSHILQERITEYGELRTVVGSASFAIALLVVAIAAMLSAQQPQSVWDGTFTDAQAKRGDQLYAKHCAHCHAADLTGGEMAPPLTGGEFKYTWNGLSLGDLFERMRISMPQDNPGGLSRQQNADVLAFMLFKSSFPPGETELASQTEVLKEIKFEADKP